MHGTHTRLFALISMIALGLSSLDSPTSSALAAQPTWGRPKETPANPRHPPTDSNDDDRGDDSDDAPAPKRPPDDPLKPVVSEPGHWTESDPEIKQPSADAEPNTWYAASSKAGHRFAWILPADFQKGSSADIVVLLHPKGMNVRWGMDTHSVADVETEERFRSDSILICIDGLTSIGRGDERRAFLISNQTIMEFRDLMLEITQSFPMRRIYLYGNETGADFAAAFANRFPALADGVMLYRASSKAAEFAAKGTSPIVFIQGARDVSLSVDVGMTNLLAYQDADHTGARFRPLPALNEFPSPLKVSECLDWAVGMNAVDPAEILARAEAIVAPKGPDEFTYAGPGWYTGAYELLLRIAPDPKPATDADAPISEPASAPSARKLDPISDEALAGATRLKARIESHADEQLSALKKLIRESGIDLKSAADFSPDGTPAVAWLWQIRHDFRGLPTVEAFVESINYDALVLEHSDRARPLIDAWSQAQDDAAKAIVAADLARTCFLAPILPVDLGSSVRRLAKSDEDVEPDLRESFELILNVEKTWLDGARAYAKVWRPWSPDE